MVALIVALGYGLGAEIPKLLGWHPWLCVGLSMVAGTVLDTLVRKLVFSETVQKTKTYSIIIFASLILVFLAIQCFLTFWLDVSLLNYVVEEYQYAIILPVLGLAASRLIRWYFVQKVRKRYADGSKGFVFDIPDRIPPKPIRSLLHHQKIYHLF